MLNYQRAIHGKHRGFPLQSSPILLEASAGVAKALKDATEETFDLKRPNKIDLGPLTMDMDLMGFNGIYRGYNGIYPLVN